MTQQGYKVSTRQFRALFMFVPLLISLFCLGCADKTQAPIPVQIPVKKVVEKKGTFAKHWNVNPGAAVVRREQIITWKAVGAQLTILNPHPELFEGGVQVLVIPKDKEGSLKVSRSVPDGEYLYAIFCHDEVKPEFAEGSDPKIIIR